MQIKGYGQARQLTLFEHDQPVLQVLTSVTRAPGADLLCWLRARWRIENMFKYASAHNGIDALADYRMDIAPNPRILPQPDPGRGPPGWMNPMLGEQARDAYLTAAEVVERLSMLATTKAGPGGRRGEPAGPRSRRLGASNRRHGDPRPHGRGGHRRRERPADTRAGPEASGRVAQYHAADYRNANSLPEGAVLVVGSGQSGSQIAEDLLATGRRVVLATSPVGRAPARHRGRDTVEWLVECGFFDQRPRELPDPSAVTAPQPLLAPVGAA